MGPQAVMTQLPAATDIQQRSHADFGTSVLSPAAAIRSQTLSPTTWSSTVNYASAVGIGDDNPTDDCTPRHAYARSRKT